MSKVKRETRIQLIDIDKINVLNPRIRNQKVFKDIAVNISQVGLKRPVTVTPTKSKVEGKDYDLICGQGRIEAYLACGQKSIPALVVDASEEEALIMSLVENLARRQHRATDLLQGVEVLQKQGYDSKEIAEKTGLSVEYVQGVRNLLERGEERLLEAVEAGQMPIALAIRIAEGPEDEQHALQEAYESKQLRGKKLLLAKRLLENRRRRGKTFAEDGRRRSGKSDRGLSAKAVLEVYQREVDRKRRLTRKYDFVTNQLAFITAALRQLLAEDNFRTLLKAEQLTSIPKPLAILLDGKEPQYG